MKIKNDFLTINYNSGTSKWGMKEIRGIVLHSMDGYYNGSINWFKNPKSEASAHYLISKEGEILHMVDERKRDRAWHAGIIDTPPAPAWLQPNGNDFCIGIELEDEGSAHWQYPQAEKDATAWLVAKLMKDYKIPRERVVLHKDINPTRRSDPQGLFSFDWVFPQEEQVSEREQTIIYIYEALLDRPPSDDELKWRLLQAKNVEEIIDDILDDALNNKVGPAWERWFDKLVKDVRTQCENSCDIDKTDLVDMHKIEIDKLHNKLKKLREEKNEDLTINELINLLLLKIIKR